MKNDSSKLQATEEKEQTLILPDRDRNDFLETLKKPPKPNRNLKKAFKEYREFFR